MGQIRGEIKKITIKNRNFLNKPISKMFNKDIKNVIIEVDFFNQIGWLTLTNVDGKWKFDHYNESFHISLDEKTIMKICFYNRKNAFKFYKYFKTLPEYEELSKYGEINLNTFLLKVVER